MKNYLVELLSESFVSVRDIKRGGGGGKSEEVSVVNCVM